MAQQNKRVYKFWTRQELNYLREAYPTVPNRVIARALSRTAREVRGAAQRHGLTKVKKLRLPVEYLGILDHVRGKELSTKLCTTNTQSAE